MEALQTIPYQTKKLQTEKLWRLNCRLAFWKFGSSFTNAGAAFPLLVWWRRLTWGASLNLRPRRLPATLARSHSAAAAATIWPLGSAFIHHLGPDDPGRRGSRSQERLKARDRRIRPALFLCYVRLLMRQNWVKRGGRWPAATPPPPLPPTEQSESLI